MAKNIIGLTVQEYKAVQSLFLNLPHWLKKAIVR